MKNKKYHHGDLRQTLLDAASKVLESEGVGGISLRAVARQAGVSHTAPYHHFPDREALLAAVALEGFAVLAERLSAAAKIGRSPRKQLERLGSAYIDCAVERPARFRLMMRPELTGGTQANSELATEADRAFGHLVDAVAKLRPDLNPEQAAIAPWCLVHGLAALTIDGALSGVELEPAKVMAPLLDQLAQKGK